MSDYFKSPPPHCFYNTHNVPKVKHGEYYYSTAEDRGKEYHRAFLAMEKWKEEKEEYLKKLKKLEEIVTYEI